AIGLDHIIHAAAQDICSFALAFVAPLGADDNDSCHGYSLPRFKAKYALTLPLSPVIMYLAMHVRILRCGDVAMPDVDFHQVSAIPTRQELKLIDASAAAIFPSDPTASLAQIPRQPALSSLRTLFPLLRVGDVAIPYVDFHQVSALPTRQELKLIDASAAAILPSDPTPSLDEIARQPDVSHLGAPQFAPQPIDKPLRIVVVGDDAALSAVLTRMMRADYMWAEVAYVPSSASTAAQNWKTPTDSDAAWALALEGEVRPVPLIRTDTGLAVAGSATVSSWDHGPLVGEIIVDDTTLVHSGERFGARL